MRNRNEYSTNKKKDTAQTSSGKVFEAWVLEKSTEQNIPYCQIYIEGIEHSFTADGAGMFSIVLPDSFATKKFKVKFTAADFASDSLLVDFYTFQGAYVMVYLKRVITRHTVTEAISVGMLSTHTDTYREPFNFSDKFFRLPERGFNLIRDIKDLIWESKAR